MSYIGNQPGVSSQRVVLEEVISGATKSAFTPTSGYVKGYVDVLVNGVEVDTADFTATDGVTVNLVNAAQIGDTVKIKTWLPRGLSDGYLKSESDARFAQIDTNTLFVDTTNHRLGIGTSTPGARIDVVADASANAIFARGRTADNIANLAFVDNGNTTNYGYIQSRGNGEIRYVANGSTSAYFQTWYTAGSERLRLDNSGNLGLAVTPSAWGSSYKSMQLGIGASIFGRSDSTAVVVGQNIYRDASNLYTYITTAAAGYYQIGSGIHSWYNAPSGSGAITFTQAMTLDASGNLGLGKLDLKIDGPFVTGGNITSGSNPLGIGTQGATNLMLFTSNTERVRIDYTGNVGIGTTSPQAKFDVNGVSFLRGTSSAFGTWFDSIATGPYGSYQYMTFDLGSTQGAFRTFAKFDAAGSGSWNVSVATTGNAYGANPSGLTYANLLILNSAGNLGIGATPSAWNTGYKALQIAGQGTAIWGSTSASQAGFNSNGYNNGTNWVYNNSAAAGSYQINGNVHQWYIAPFGSLGTNITFTQAMTLDASGMLYVGANQRAMLYQDISGDAVVGGATGGTLKLFSTGSERARIDSSGNFGIGTTSPNFKTHISTGSSTSITQPTAGSYGLYVQQNTSGSTGGIYIQDGAANSGASLVIADNNGVGRLVVNGDGTLYLGAISSALANENILTGGQGGGIQLIRNASGNPTSGQSLGSFAWKGVDSANTNAAAEAMIEAVAAENFTGSTAATNLLFYTKPSGTGPGSSPTERARIDSSGNLQLGLNAGSSAVRLNVQSGGATSATYATYVGNSAATMLHYVRSDGAFSTGVAASSPYNLTIGSAANVYIDSSGLLYRSTSSLKYKTDVKDAKHGLADVMALRPVTYRGKGDADAGKVYGGLIAEEVHAAGLTEFVQYAEDGSPDALHYANMVALCVKAIQEQQALITQLQAEVKTLKEAA